MADGNGGSLSPSGRFDRMEASLARIEEKLGSKAGYDDLRPLIRRLELLEAGESPLGRVMLEQFTSMQKQLNEIVLHGSEQARIAGRRVSEAEGKIARLEEGRAAHAVLTEDRRERDQRSSRLRMLYVSAVSAAALIVSVVQAIHS